MTRSLTVRVIVGLAVGLVVWFMLISLVNGLTNIEVAAILVISTAAAVATFIGLGRTGRMHTR
jgi:hypothetical protein